mmetsp:Transcript_17298/g.31132  ORF Transcript_17298/g.31132 Transcript_17298/m.31132 type:complete len:849 (+) Transcript_17298:1305-3851(+)
MLKVMPYESPPILNPRSSNKSLMMSMRFKEHAELNTPRKIPVFSIMGKCQARWASVTSFLAVCTIFAVPFLLAFTPDLAASKEMVGLEIAVDTIYIFDILLTFRTSFISSYTGDEISSPKEIALHYLGGKFIIDVLAAFPFDHMILGNDSVSSAWKAVSLLRILRVYRLKEMLVHLRARNEVKLMFKFCQLLLFILMYVHVVGCAWFMLVNSEETWVPPCDIVLKKTDLYEMPAWEQYWYSFYHSTFLLCGIEILVSNETEYAFAVSFYIIGAIITAIIVGEMAVVSTSLNHKWTHFAVVSDNANTTMKNMKLPESLQLKIFDYLMSTNKILEFKEELESFEMLMPPSMQQEVRACIYKGVVTGNDLFSKNAEFAEAATRLFKSIFYQPDEAVVSLGEESTCMFFISSGKCQVEVLDEYRQWSLVRYLRPGDYFGELGLIYDTKRTASVITSMYSNVAKIEKNDFKRLMKNFPEVCERLKARITEYKDPYRCFLKNCLSRIAYLKGLPEPLQDALIYEMQTKSYDANVTVVGEGEVCSLMIILEGALAVSFKVKSSCKQFKLTDEEGISSTSFQKKRGWSIINTFEGKRMRSKSRMFSYINQSNDHNVKLIELEPGGILGVRQVLVQATNILRIKTIEPTTVLVLEYATLHKFTKLNTRLKDLIDQAKGSLEVFDNSCNEKLIRAPLIDYLPMFTPNHILIERKLFMSRLKLQNAIIRVIKRNREISVKGTLNISNFLKKLNAIKSAEEMGLVELAKDIASGEVDPEVIETANLLSPDEVAKPMLNKFAMAAKESVKAVGKAGEQFEEVEAELLKQQYNLDSFINEVEELREMVMALELATVGHLGST